MNYKIIAAIAALSLSSAALLALQENTDLMPGNEQPMSEMVTPTPETPTPVLPEAPMPNQTSSEEMVSDMQTQPEKPETVMPPRAKGTVKDLGIVKPVREHEIMPREVIEQEFAEQEIGQECPMEDLRDVDDVDLETSEIIE